MMRKSIATLALVAGVVMIPAPAEAKWNGGSIKHDDDPGLDTPILVSCSSTSTGSGENDTYSVSEGKHSDDICPDEDVDKVYVRYGEELWCLKSLPRLHWSKEGDATGWYTMGDFTNLTCEVRAD